MRHWGPLSAYNITHSDGHEGGSITKEKQEKPELAFDVLAAIAIFDDTSSIGEAVAEVIEYTEMLEKKIANLENRTRQALLDALAALEEEA